MRFIKFFSIAAAVLAVASCNKQIEQPVDGDLTEVTVNVALPGNVATKAIDTPTQDQGTTPVLIDDVAVTLYYAGGSETKSVKNKEIDFKGGNTASVVFTAHNSPYKVEVSVNGGTKDNLTLAQINETGKGLYAKMFASTTNLVPGEDNTATASIEVEHRYSRIEISGIYHKDTGDDCMFATINFAGLYLNNVAETEKAAASTYPNFDGANASVKDVATDNFKDTDFDNSLPAAGQCYAYNVFTTDGSTPEIVLVFNGITGVDDAHLGDTRYATITKFINSKDKSPITEFVKGTIYRITDVAVADEYTSTTPEGPVDVTLTATVTVLPWNIVDTEIGWN